MRKIVSVKERAELLGAFENGGLARKEFCAKAGIGLSTLSKWLSDARGAKFSGSKSREFIEVVSGDYELRYGAVTIKVPHALGVKGVSSLVKELC